MSSKKAPPKSNKPRNRAQFNLRGRLAMVAGTLGLCSLALLGRAVDLQVVDNDFYQKQGDARFLREIPIPTSRGMITDRNGEPLAVSSPVETIWGNPQELLKQPQRLPELAKALGIPVEHLTRKLSQRADKEFVYLKRRINPDAARKILAHEIPGVFSQREFRRFYPQGEAVAHVLGFTNIDDRGQEGLELAFDDWLRGKAGAKKVIRDRRGRVVENVDLVRAAEPGHDLTLSIDRRIQFLAYRELKGALLEHGAGSGSAVVLDVATGEVLAMANLPSYNPNAVDAGQRDAHRNRAVTDLLEPGSTMKPITVAAALEAGVITPQTRFDTNPGWMPNGRFRTTDTHNYGVLTTVGVITKSSNVGASKIALRLSNRQFYDYVRKLGYGRSTGSGFPGEAAGLFPSPDRWSGTSKQTMSYGYGLNATPLQIAAAYAALGNGGKLIAPTFVKGQRNEARQAMDPGVAREVVRMMETVTLPGGTAPHAHVLGYRVAGKTGTARKASGGGYSRRYVSYFAGLVPASNPRFSMVVVINDPDVSKGWTYGGGGRVSAPVFHNVMDGALRLMDVAPDDLDAWLAAQAAAEAKRNARMPLASDVPIAAAPTAASAAPLLPAQRASQ
ncbi:penicillin-binding transpeptidase domain-containing protein [Lysobacter sp. CFH 32150]|uniref:peptidoglycan D,D-transpeptidase FtsI family protein n=1 Tax=Lysobacter sp. CFH 32150 TaxID=2927128 RepID=UPI001FA7BAFC|nr:penicillin-binding transpeptidase domain-containing protein [Lysobacter sp. CFH 32150]MCI4567702.1 penicillin-binding protein 2 [Lysobacter sp. CFH 32150]